MKKLNLLTKAEMKRVLGGVAPAGGSYIDVCNIFITYADGKTRDEVSFWDGAGSGDTNAKSDCAGYMAEKGAVKCQYDCGSDGFTASWDPAKRPKPM